MYNSIIWVQCLEYSKIRLSTVWVQSEYSLNTGLVQSEYSLSTVWIQSEYSLSTGLVQSEYSLSTVWVQDSETVKTQTFYWNPHRNSSKIGILATLKKWEHLYRWRPIDFYIAVKHQVASGVFVRWKDRPYQNWKKCVIFWQNSCTLSELVRRNFLSSNCWIIHIYTVMYRKLDILLSEYKSRRTAQIF